MWLFLAYPVWSAFAGALLSIVFIHALVVILEPIILGAQNAVKRREGILGFRISGDITDKQYDALIKYALSIFDSITHFIAGASLLLGIAGIVERYFPNNYVKLEIESWSAFLLMCAFFAFGMGVTRRLFSIKVDRRALERERVALR